MKRIAIATIAILALTTAASADYRRNQRYHGQGRGSNWIAPVIGGLLLGGAIAGSYGYYQRRPTCWNEPVYAYNRRGDEIIVRYDRFCE